MLWSDIALGNVFYIFFSFRNALKHIMCQINYDDGAGRLKLTVLVVK